MADSPSAPATRGVSPTKLPPSQAATKLEDNEDEETTSASEDQHSLSALSEWDANESLSGLAGGLSAPTPSPPDEAAADTIEDMSNPAVQTRCVVNFLDPQPGECDSKITNDDRHYISNFFGRNKSCSTSIPDEFYQVLCRKCMQAMKYRLQSGKGATEIQVQVAAIKHALRNMAASGRWVCVEVQLTKSEYDRRQSPEKFEEEIRKFNEDIIRSREEAKQKGVKARRRNTKKAPPPVPDWLAELVVRSDNNANQDYSPVHERDPTRWSFEHLTALVDMIGESCEILPNIECLVVTQGELDRVSLEGAKLFRKQAKRELQLLSSDITRAEEDMKQDPKNKLVEGELQDYRDRTAFMEKRLEDAEEEVKKASEILEKTAHTIPPKREQLKRSGPTKGESSKSATKKEKSKKSKTEHVDSQATITEPDVDAEVRQHSPSDVEMAEAGSPTPPPGWKGKGKAQTDSEPKSATSKGKRKQEPGARIFSAPKVPSTPLPQTQEAAPAAAAVPGTPPAQALTVAAPVTPNQPTSTISPTSTTRSTGRRLQLTAERDHGQQQQQQHGGGGIVTEQGSPRGKKGKRVASKD
jgi:hypothetical protein